MQGWLVCTAQVLALLVLSAWAQDNTCDVSGSRQDCGYAGITLDDCENKGCCWYPVYNNPDNLPWCFYKNYQSPAPPTSVQCSNIAKAMKEKFLHAQGNFFMSREEGTYFAVWAPNAAQIWITGEFSGETLTQSLSLCDKDGYWATQISSAQPGDSYSYLVNYVGVNYTRVDPFARITQQDSKGNYIGSVIHDPNFDWGEAANFVPPSHFEQVIYEMQISTFNPQTPGGVSTFADVIKQLDYLQHLGVNVIEPIPVIEFPGDPRGWGYNPGVPFSIEQAFGGYDGLKQFVKEANLRGMAVYIDIVWNHMNGPPSNGLWQYDGWYSYDDGFPSGYGLPGGIYFYQDSDAETSWGPRPNYANSIVRDYIAHNVEMLMVECHASGFRWDSTICIRKGGTQCWYMPTDNLDGITVLQDSTTVTRSFGGFSIAEDLQNNNTVTTPVSQGGIGFDAQWDDTTWYLLDDVLGSQSDSSRQITDLIQAIEGSYPGGDYGNGRVIYTENHDKASGQNAGQGRWPNIVDAADPTSYIATKLSTLGICTVLVSPGVPLIFYGQEFLDTENFAFGNVPDFPWSDVGQYSNGTWTSIGAYNGIFNMTRDLIRLRLNYDNVSTALTTTNINMYWSSQSDLVVAFTRGSNQDMVIVMNLKGYTYSSGYNVGVPYGGTWNISFNSDLQKYSPLFGNTGASQSSLSAKNTPTQGFSYQVTVPLGAYSCVILTQA